MRYYSLLALAAMGQTVMSSDVCTQKNVMADIRAVENNINHNEFFCEYYISAKRVYSPLSILTTQRMTQACECITGLKHKTKAAPHGKTPYKSQKTCNKRNMDLVKSEYRLYRQFCTWFLADRYREGASPMTTISSNAVIYGACECLLEGQAAATTPAAISTSAKPTKHKKKPTTTLAASETATTGSDIPTTEPSATNSDMTSMAAATTTSVAETPSATPTMGPRDRSDCPPAPYLTSNSDYAKYLTSNSTILNMTLVEAMPEYSGKYWNFPGSLCDADAINNCSSVATAYSNDIGTIEVFYVPKNDSWVCLGMNVYPGPSQWSDVDPDVYAAYLYQE
ncbi:hypothetical protein ANO11243_056990 [Dothideomycetidae sp. 11243]|nr:hypothetical protein ANO11243_056990 [fungal sp. No.11243]